MKQLHLKLVKRKNSTSFYFQFDKPCFFVHKNNELEIVFQNKELENLFTFINYFANEADLKESAREL
jgi:hypothetical protein